MKIEAILKLKDGADIDKMKVRIKKIADLKEPTQLQKQAGIHNQSFLVFDDTGEIWCQIANPSMHLPKEAEGQVFYILPHKDGGNQTGLFVRAFTGKDNVVKKSVTIGSKCVVTKHKDPEEKREETVSTPATETKKAPRPKEDANSIALQHRQCFDAVVEAYKDVEIRIESLLEIATMIFHRIPTKFFENCEVNVIEGMKPSDIKRPDKVVDDRSTHKELRDKVTGKLVPEMSDLELLDFRIRLEGLDSKSKENPRVIAFFDLVIADMLKRNLNWTHCWSSMSEKFFENLSDMQVIEFKVKTEVEGNKEETARKRVIYAIEMEKTLPQHD